MTEHLNPKVKKILEYPVERRLEFLKRDRWIPHKRATGILNKLVDVFNDREKTRMLNLLIVAPSNNGKTHLLKNFLKMNAPSDDPNKEHSWVPILSIQSPPGPDERRLFTTILEAIFAPTRGSASIDQNEIRVVRLLRDLRVGMLVIDEAQDAFSRNPSQHKYYLNVIKRLGNTLKVPIVMAGTKAVLKVTQIDDQYANRFEPVYMPRWVFDQEFIKLLTSFESILPLREASVLGSQALGLKLHTLSEGLIGELSKLLERSARFAIEQGHERIDLEIVNTIVEQKLFVSPKDRNKDSEQLGLE
jgi:Bacterial TniB protein